MDFTNLAGLSHAKPATPEIQSYADQVKGQLEDATGKNYATYTAILYRQQPVAGMDYFVKVKCGEENQDYVHMRIFKALPYQGGPIDLSGFQLGKTLSDPITYF
ncbi:cystatin-A1-like [Erythrolamprus reginae]|uniref:cystatin-A1-like n=1 Tax=Erythrolamprus reginae TaxID=121349 RepID=UPI00396C8D74